MGRNQQARGDQQMTMLLSYQNHTLTMHRFLHHTNDNIYLAFHGRPNTWQFVGVYQFEIP